ncbi:MAG TPA: hypothetical protein DHV39_14600 [Verrucomicrobiales bacterium]|nr:hypothetical protein [Verrucomicrobiales bacterium]
MNHGQGNAEFRMKTSCDLILNTWTLTPQGKGNFVLIHFFSYIFLFSNSNRARMLHCFELSLR